MTVTTAPDGNVYRRVPTQITFPTHERRRHAEYPAVGWLRPLRKRGTFTLR